MNRFNGPDDGREKEADRDVRPDWYDALGREPGPMSKEPTLAQMRKIKEESTMKNGYAPTIRSKGKMAFGAIVAAGVIVGGVWGANAAGWLDGGTPNVAQTQAGGQAQAPDRLSNVPLSAEKEAEAQAREVAEAFKKADLTVTPEQLNLFESEFRSGDEDGAGIAKWIEIRQKELSPYAESEFLSTYFVNQAGNLPYEAAIAAKSELAVEQIDMTTRSVDADNGQVVFDYTLNLVFSGDRDPLPMKGSIRMQKGEDGWKVKKDTPQQASYLELYKIARPELAGDE